MMDTSELETGWDKDWDRSTEDLRQTMIAFAERQREDIKAEWIALLKQRFGQDYDRPYIPPRRLDEEHKKTQELQGTRDPSVGDLLPRENSMLPLSNFVEQVAGQKHEVSMVDFSTENPKMEWCDDDFELLKQTQDGIELVTRIQNTKNNITHGFKCSYTLGARKNLGVRKIHVERRYHRAREKKSTKYIPRHDLVQALKCYGMFRSSVFKGRLENRNVERAHYKGRRSMVDTDQHQEVCNDGALSCELKECSTENHNSDAVEESENSITSGSQEVSPTSGPTIQILQKVIDLSNKIKVFKDVHVSVSNQVKEIKNCSFVEPEMSKALQLLTTEHGTLKKQYLEESSEKKQLYNEVIELKGNMRVFCRCRPLNPAQSHIFAALQALKVIESEARPYDLCTRREFAHWVISTSNALTRNSTLKVYPAMYIENVIEIAFDDITPDDPNFPFIQGLAEAGLISSKLSKDDMPSVESSQFTFSPKSPLTRQDLLSWKMALEFRQLPEADSKKLYQLSGFRDIDKINPEAWPVLIADLSAEEHEMTTFAFGRTRVFQPSKAVTKAQTAGFLKIGEAFEIVSEELTRIEAEAMTENVVSAHNALVAQVKKDINASFEKEILREKEIVDTMEKFAEEAKSELARLIVEKEEEALALKRERTSIETEMKALARLRNELEEQFQSLVSNKAEMSYEKERFDRLQKQMEEENQEIIRLQNELDVNDSSPVIEETGKNVADVYESPFQQSKRNLFWRNEEPSMSISVKDNTDQMMRKALHRAHYDFSWKHGKDEMSSPGVRNRFNFHNQVLHKEERFPTESRSYALQSKISCSSPANAMNRGSASRNHHLKAPAKFENSDLNLQRKSHTRVEESFNRSFQTELWSSIGNANNDYTSPDSVLDATFSIESCFSNSFDNISVPGQMGLPLEPIEPYWDIRRAENGNEAEILVQWTGLPTLESTWEFLSSLVNQFLDFNLEDKVNLLRGSINRLRVPIAVMKRKQRTKGRNSRAKEKKMAKEGIEESGKEEKTLIQVEGSV